MVMPVMAEDIATNQFVIPTTMPPLEPRIENPTFTVTDAPDSVVSSVKDGMENLPVYDPNNDTAPKEYLMVVEPHHKFQEPLKVRPETDGIVIHHVAIPSGNISFQAIHKAHLKNGWAGIGYHFVIRKDGTIERGRPLSVVGAHAQGDNLHTIGICMARNFEKEYVGAEQYNALVKLVAELADIYNLDASTAISGHRNHNDTICPGEHLYEELPDLRLDVKAEMTRHEFEQKLANLHLVSGK